MIDSFDTPQSSTIVRVTYDGDQQILNVEFKNGNYDYYDVPVNVFEGMRNAPSTGQYLAQEIKGRYRYSRA
jgi:KTSC domain